MEQTVLPELETEAERAAALSEIYSYLLSRRARRSSMQGGTSASIDRPSPAERANERSVIAHVQAN